MCRNANDLANTCNALSGGAEQVNLLTFKVPPCVGDITATRLPFGDNRNHGVSCRLPSHNLGALAPVNTFDYSRRFYAIAALVLASITALAATAVAAQDYQLQPLTTELSSPWAIAVTPAGELFISERTGSLRHFSSAGLSAPIKAVPSVYFRGQGGLLDVALHPNFADNQQLFLSMAAGEPDANYLQVVAAKWHSDANQLQDVKIIFKTTPPKDTPVHYGGRMAVLPDNTLLVTMGDGFDYRESAQRENSMLGKILRINFDGSPAENNPFTTSTTARYIWSLGHRNPQGLFYDAGSGLLFEHEHGPAGGDEINIIVKGKNYGWPVITKGKDYSGAQITPYTSYPGMEQPLFDWTPSVAPSDMIWYRGTALQQLTDKLLVTTLKSREVQVLSYSDQQIRYDHSLFTEANERFRAIEQDPQGNVYLLTDSGVLYRITSSSHQTPPQ